MESIDVLIACIRKLGGEDLEVQESNLVDFQVGDLPAYAYVKDGGRMRGSVVLDFLPAAQMDEALHWAEQQNPSACRVDVVWASESDDDEVVVRLLFERDLDIASIADDDPLATEADILARSWYGEELPDTRPSRTRLSANDPTAQSPTNAWLLMGSEDSYPTEEDITDSKLDAALGIYEGAWTAAKQTEPGDLLFFYFINPRRTINYVARAVDHAFFEHLDNPEERWNARQWWVHITPMIEIEPIRLSELRRVTGDMVMLGGRGRYLRPEHAAQLADRARPKRPEDSDTLCQLLQPVVGRADHPDPTSLDLHRWQQLPAGTLALEADVERLIVEPLLRFTLGDHPQVSLSKAHRAGPRIVDYVVLQDAHPACAIEVKLRVRRSPLDPWAQCADFRQAADYGQRLGVPAILIDAFEIHLIPIDAQQPSRTFIRAGLRQDDLVALRDHILGPSGDDGPSADR